MVKTQSISQPKSTSSAHVSVENLQRVFGKDQDKHVALTGVSFEIKAREFIGVVGPSGCGKSTLLKLIAGLLRCTEGKVFIEDQEMTGPRDDVGLMFQTPTLFPWRTVKKNILLPFEVRGDKDTDRERRLTEALDLVGLAGLENRLPRELSGGMQQRVALCRLLVSDPNLMLMDEPFGSLDEFTRERLNVELARITEHEGKTALFVTHNISEAVFLSDRIVVMGTNPGRVLGIVKIDLPRPRVAALLTSPDHLAKVQQVREVLGLG